MSLIPYITAEEIKNALPMRRAIDIMRNAFRALGENRVTMPVRTRIYSDKGVTLFMPALIKNEPGGQLGQKVVSVFGGNRDKGLPVIHGIVIVIDAMTGQPRALLDGMYLTQLRTGAVTGLATEMLSKQDAKTLTVFGAGGQAEQQIEAVLATRPIEHITIISRSDSSRALCERLQAQDKTRRYEWTNERERATRQADVIVTTTTSTEPLFDGAWVKHGAHVNAIGAYRPDMREVDATLLNRADVFVDQREAALEEAGDLLIPNENNEWSLSNIKGELSELVLGNIIPDTTRTTFFKSCGLAVEDIAAASAVVDALS
jgi:ornithine cyclodeaminase